MNISMAGVDYKSAPLSLREKIAFDTDAVKKITSCIAAEENIAGCVIVSTCNRTEIYISGTERVNAAELLFRYCDADCEEFRSCLRESYDYEAALYLAEVACGLHSAILCEEQIVTQLGDAVEVSRSIGCADSVLNTMFRCAVTAGKRALTDFCVRAVPLSAAQAAADRAEELYGTLEDKKALIVGNGKMGLLAAEALLKKGCGVYITLRRYKHGDNIVPGGAETVDFADRMKTYEECDFIITATRSPHYTIYCDAVKKCRKQPDYIFDLAVPRDVEPGTENHTSVLTIDDLCSGDTVDKETLAGIRDTAKKQTEKFMRWRRYREKRG
ncbi:MAG: glutamyl-tRNA reductase [Clostridiales bacterium]|nr:glutamyl-tRNA reductase [Clostridiales bacterium]